MAVADFLNRDVTIEELDCRPGKLIADEGHPLNDIAMAIHRWGVEKGWSAPDGWLGWSDKAVQEELTEKLLLIITEVAEAYEHWRNGLGIKDIVYYKDGKPDGIGIELADAAIRILHLCALAGWDIDKLLAIKMAYNEKRAFRHGNKRA